MQERLYADAYVNVLYYPNVLEAYRSDVIGSMLKQPQPDGMYSGQDGYWSWWSAAPPAAGGKRSSDPGPATIAKAVAAVVVLGAGAALLIARRRRASADERE
jgi:peptide/nickel transport system substrate-binding protein